MSWTTVYLSTFTKHFDVVILDDDDFRRRASYVTLNYGPLSVQFLWIRSVLLSTFSLDCGSHGEKEKKN